MASKGKELIYLWHFDMDKYYHIQIHIYMFHQRNSAYKMLIRPFTHILHPILSTLWDVTVKYYSHNVKSLVYELIIKMLWNCILLYFSNSKTHLVTSFHMPKQLSCHGMCRSVTWWLPLSIMSRTTYVFTRLSPQANIIFTKNNCWVSVHILWYF